MKDLKHEGKDYKSEIKAAGPQDNRTNKQQGGTGGAYNPQQKQTDKTTQQNPLPGKGQNIGQGGINRNQGGVGGGTGGKVDFNKDKGSWK